METWTPLAKGSHGGLWVGDRDGYRPFKKEKVFLTGWSADSVYVYYGLEVKSAAPDTLQVLPSDYAKDKDYVFSYGKIVEEADAGTFVVHDGITRIHQGLGGVDSHDQSNQYSAGELVKPRSKTAH